MCNQRCHQPCNHARATPHRLCAREAAYTCWSTASGARVNNWGTRIDLVLVSTAGGAACSLAAACTAADIMPEVSCKSKNCSRARPAFEVTLLSLSLAARSGVMRSSVSQVLQSALEHDVVCMPDRCKGQIMHRPGWISACQPAQCRQTRRHRLLPAATCSVRPCS